MPQKSTKLHDSKPRTEEADWDTSPEGRRQTQREFERALKAGTLDRSSGTRVPRTDPNVLSALLEQAKANATRPVSIRLYHRRHRTREEDCIEAGDRIPDCTKRGDPQRTEADWLGQSRLHRTSVKLIH
jgi:hypothetical protein